MHITILYRYIHGRDMHITIFSESLLPLVGRVEKLLG